MHPDFPKLNASVSVVLEKPEYFNAIATLYQYVGLADSANDTGDYTQAFQYAATARGIWEGLETGIDWSSDVSDIILTWGDNEVEWDKI